VCPWELYRDDKHARQIQAKNKSETWREENNISYATETNEHEI
jgi:hypothetical protein